MDDDVRLRDVLNLASNAACGAAQAIAHRRSDFPARETDVSIEQNRFGSRLRVSDISRYSKDQQAERKKSHEHAASKRVQQRLTLKNP
jgi:hypothetical protein